MVIHGAGGNFCSGGDVHEIIGPLLQMDGIGLLRFTRMTGDLVKAMRRCPLPVIAAIDGVCAGAGGGDRHGRRPASGHRTEPHGLPVYAGRTCGLRHGGLRPAAAHHRPGAGGGTVVYPGVQWRAKSRTG